MRRVLFIFNRHAGKTKVWYNLGTIINAMTEQGCIVTAYPTQFQGDATEAIRRWSQDYDQIVVAGGDGTLGEAVAGAITLPVPPVIGYIPIGTTNDFSKNLDLPLGNLAKLAATAVTGPIETHDVGSFNGKSFLYVAAFGAFTEVSYNTPQRTKNLLGYNAYMLESIKYLNTLRPHHVTVEHDGETFSGDYIYGMVSNTTSVGRFRNFPPGHPDLSDGLLEVTLIPPLKDLQSIEHFSRAILLNDSSIIQPMLTTFTTSHVRITCESDLSWTLDGENGGIQRDADIIVIPRAYHIRHGDPTTENT